MAHPFTEFLNVADYSDLPKLAAEVNNFAKVNNLHAQYLHYPMHLAKELLQAYNDSHGDSPLVGGDFLHIIVTRSSTDDMDVSGVKLFEYMGNKRVRVRYFPINSQSPIVTYTSDYKFEDEPFAQKAGGTGSVSHFTASDVFGCDDAYESAWLNYGKLKNRVYGGWYQDDSFKYFDPMREFIKHFNGYLNDKRMTIDGDTIYIQFRRQPLFIETVFRFNFFCMSHDAPMLLTIDGRFPSQHFAKEELKTVIDFLEGKRATAFSELEVEIERLTRLEAEKEAAAERREVERYQRQEEIVKKRPWWKIIHLK